MDAQHIQFKEFESIPAGADGEQSLELSIGKTHNGGKSVFAKPHKSNGFVSPEVKPPSFCDAAGIVDSTPSSALHNPLWTLSAEEKSIGASIMPMPSYGAVDGADDFQQHNVIGVESGVELMASGEEMLLRSGANTVHDNFESVNSLHDIDSKQRDCSDTSPRKEFNEILEPYEPVPYVWSFITAEISALLFMYMINKAGQDLCLSSMPMLTGALFGWSSERAGYFMGLLGAIVLPCVIAGNMITVNMQDREALLWLVALAVVGAVGVLNCSFAFPTLHYSEVQYVATVSLLYGVLNTIEGFLMALLSKLVSPALAQGTFNSGFLASEAGTLGRVLGDVSITAIAVVATSRAVPAVPSSPGYLVNLFYLPLIAALLVSILLLQKLYDRFLV